MGHGPYTGDHNEYDDDNERNDGDYDDEDEDDYNDLIYDIQVEQIHTRFQGLHDLKRANWVVKVSKNKNKFDERQQNFSQQGERMQQRKQLIECAAK